MTKTRKRERKPLHIILQPDVRAALYEAAEKERRTITAIVEYALELYFQEAASKPSAK